MLLALTNLVTGWRGAWWWGVGAGAPVVAHEVVGAKAPAAAREPFSWARRRLDELRRF